MSERVGRNDPCPCGSGKKYKNCCLEKNQAKPTLGLKGRKFTAKVLSGGGVVNPEQKPDQGQQKLIMPVDYNVLMERSFGDSLRKYGDKPPIPENPSDYVADNRKSEEAE
jgi:uncharacterized protein